MSVSKTCTCYGKAKRLADFFFRDGVGAGVFCKQCHAAGKVKHGYGWYGDRYTCPEDTGAGGMQ